MRKKLEAVLRIIEVIAIIVGIMLTTYFAYQQNSINKTIVNLERLKHVPSIDVIFSIDHIVYKDGYLQISARDEMGNKEKEVFKFKGDWYWGVKSIMDKGSAIKVINRGDTTIKLAKTAFMNIENEEEIGSIITSKGIDGGFKIEECLGLGESVANMKVGDRLDFSFWLWLNNDLGEEYCGKYILHIARYEYGMAFSVQGLSISQAHK